MPSFGVFETAAQDYDKIDKCPYTQSAKGKNHENSRNDPACIKPMYAQIAKEKT